MKKTVIETCEFCGKQIKGESSEVKIEGALLMVCSNCTQWGNPVKSKTSAIPSKPSSRQSMRRGAVRSVRKSSSIKPRFKGKQIPNQKVLADDFGKLIQQGRSKLKFTQKKLAQATGISATQIQSFETERMKPNDADIRKLERTLKISLMEELELDREHVEKKKAEQTTLGDIVILKKR